MAERLSAGLIGRNATDRLGSLKMCDPCYIGIDPALIEVDAGGSGWRYTVLLPQTIGRSHSPTVDSVAEEVDL